MDSRINSIGRTPSFGSFSGEVKYMVHRRLPRLTGITPPLGSSHGFHLFDIEQLEKYPGEICISTLPGIKGKGLILKKKDEDIPLTPIKDAIKILSFKEFGKRYKRFKSLEIYFYEALRKGIEETKPPYIIDYGGPGIKKRGPLKSWHDATEYANGTGKYDPSRR